MGKWITGARADYSLDNSYQFGRGGVVVAPELGERVLAFYFNVMGGNSLVSFDQLVDSSSYTLAEKGTWAAMPIDFNSTMSLFSITVSGNNHTDAVLYVVEKGEHNGWTESQRDEWRGVTYQNFAWTTQAVVIPAGWDGEMTCQNEGFATDNTAAIRGVCVQADDSTYRYTGLQQCQIQVETEGQTQHVSAAHTRFAYYAKTAGNLGGAPIPMGDPLHWQSTRVADTPGEYPDPLLAPEDARQPINACASIVRASGTWRFLTATANSSDFTTGSSERIELNRLENDGGVIIYGSRKISVSLMEPDTKPPYSQTWANPGGQLSVNSSDRLSYFWVGENLAYLERVSCIFQPGTSAGRVDWHIQENWQESRYGTDRPDGYIPDWVTLTTGGTRNRKRLISPLGTFGHTGRFALWRDGDMTRKEFEVTFPLTVRITNLRAHLDEWYSNERTVTLGVLVDGEESDEITVAVRGYGWAENSSDFIDIPANTPFCLFTEASDADHVYSHITSIEYTIAVAPDARECLVRVLPDATPVTALPCSTAFARCVRIERTDGEVFAYTDHDEAVIYDGTTYRSCVGFSGSATELGSVIGEVGNMEIAGALTDLGITVEDVYGGLFDGATVDVYLIDWRTGESPTLVRRIGGGTIGKTTQSGKRFVMEALSPSAYLKQKPLLEVVTPSCRFDLGSTRCGVDIEALKVTGVVTGIYTDANNDAVVRRKFIDVTRSEGEGYFAEGIITWTSGANSGHRSKVKNFGESGDSPSTYIVTLWEPMVHPIQVGDTYEMTPGCDKLFDTCREKFNNGINFGGFPHVPGLDATSETPDVKESS